MPCHCSMVKLCWLHTCVGCGNTEEQHLFGEGQCNRFLCKEIIKKTNQTSESTSKIICTYFSSLLKAKIGYYTKCVLKFYLMFFTAEC